MPDSIYDRVELAAEQLEVAIELFLAGRSDVAALSLAGAAEEILGRAVTLQGQKSVVDEAHELISEGYAQTHGRSLTRSVFTKEWNYARNAAKHLDNDSERSLKLDLRRAAQWMIVRACSNHQRLGLPRTDGMRDFDSWFFEHEVGV